MREPILIGYFAKDRASAPSGFRPNSVREICSVSGCIASQPDDWIDEWKHNDWFVFDEPEVARQIAEKSVPAPVTYAYLVLPVRFDPTGEEVDLRIEGANPAPRPSSFLRLGFDVASRSITPEFECSPLSCNELAVEVPVNSMCLIETLPTAIEFARRCASEQPEPGSYFVIEVWRQRS